MSTDAILSAFFILCELLGESDLDRDIDLALSLAQEVDGNLRTALKRGSSPRARYCGSWPAPHPALTSL